MTIAQTLPRKEKAGSLQATLTVLGGAGLLYLAQQIRFFLPISPVPFAIVLQVALMLTVLFGMKGFYATCTYLSTGLMGLPGFASPAIGYLIGYAVLTLFVAYRIERMEERTERKIFGLMLLGNAIVYLFGVPYLALSIGWKSAFVLGCLPFLAGDFLKVCLVQTALRRLKYFG